MRVSDRMMYDLAARDGGRARSRLEEATAEAASGQRVVHPSDDPGAAGLIALHRATADRLDAIRAVAGRASDELGAADSALSDVTNALARARELAMQLSSGTYDAQARASGATEVRGLLQGVLASLNVRVGGRFVFGGRADGTAPFDAAGAYGADPGVRQVEIAPGVYQDASIRADVAVKGAGGGVDVLATLDALATALSANDAAGVAATLAAIDTGTSQLAAARAQAGSAMAAFDSAATASRTAADAARAQVSSLGDADAIEAASKLALAQHALDAALTATAQGFRLSLLDRI